MSRAPLGRPMALAALTLGLGLAAPAFPRGGPGRGDRVMIDVWVVTKAGTIVGREKREGTQDELSKLRENRGQQQKLTKKYGGDRADVYNIPVDYCGVLWTDSKGRFRIDHIPSERKAKSDQVPIVEREKGTLLEIACSTLQPDSKRDPELPRKCMVERFRERDLDEMYPPGSSFTIYYYLQGWYRDEKGYIAAGAVTPILAMTGTATRISPLSKIVGSINDRGRKELDAAVARNHPGLKPGIHLTITSPFARAYHWDRDCVEADRAAQIAHITWPERKYPPNSHPKLFVAKTEGYAHASEELGIAWKLADGARPE
jgi:hypothetical protein